jgi:hydroxymethylpyrimidine/phosphomethylpyrimidine kinase
MKVAMTIAGSDSSGGAGLQADLKAFSVVGVHGTCAVTAITAQNTTGVAEVLELPLGLIRRQIDFTCDDLPPDAVKTGMLGSAGVIECVAEAIRERALGRYVCDPVMVAKSGASLLRDDAIAELRTRLIPLAEVITPNRHEAAALLEADPEALDSVGSAGEAARRLATLGCRAVVIKAIPSGVGRLADVLYDGAGVLTLPVEALPSGRNHGSGCAFAAGIAAGLAKGMGVREAVQASQLLVHRAIREAAQLGRGVRPVNLLIGRV